MQLLENVFFCQRLVNEKRQRENTAVYSVTTYHFWFFYIQVAIYPFCLLYAFYTKGTKIVLINSLFNVSINPSILFQRNASK